MCEKYYHHADDASWRLVLNEAVIVRPGQGDMAVLNESGSLVWFWVDGLRTYNDLIAMLKRVYDLDQEPDITDFMNELVGAGLLVVEESAGVASETLIKQPMVTRFEVPRCKVREPLEALAAACGSAWTVAGSCSPQVFGACVDPWD